MDAATFTWQIVWLVITISVLYGGMVGKGGVIGKLSSIVKTRKKKVSSVEVIESGKELVMSSEVEGYLKSV